MLARAGQLLDISKTKAGQTLDKTQFYGQSVDKVWTLRKIGQTMDKLWTKFGQSLDICPGFVQTPIVHQHPIFKEDSAERASTQQVEKAQGARRQRWRARRGRGRVWFYTQNIDMWGLHFVSGIRPFLTLRTTFSSRSPRL